MLVEVLSLSRYNHTNTILRYTTTVWCQQQERESLILGSLMSSLSLSTISRTITKESWYMLDVQGNTSPEQDVQHYCVKDVYLLELYYLSIRCIGIITVRSREITVTLMSISLCQISVSHNSWNIIMSVSLNQ
jgi:hypothetical protein